ncbi:MAG: hypothetical protein KGJ25_03745 [Betaproteobacteria bacterium]|nr:hypothetical protein [Betaproteobacteria bacterium]
MKLRLSPLPAVLPALLPAVLLLMAAAGPARADTEAAAGLRHCRSLPEPGARLACYDALPLAPTLREAPVAPPAPPAPAAPSQAQREAAFGLAEPPAGQVQAITSHIPGHFQGWDPGTVITLANGQVWQITDDTSAAYELDNPRVTVRRAALGSFMLDIEGARRTPRARRLR